LTCFFDSEASKALFVIAKLRKSAPGTDRLAEAEKTFDDYCKGAVKRKKAVVVGKADARDFESWMLGQRDTIDRLME